MILRVMPKFLMITVCDDAGILHILKIMLEFLMIMKMMLEF